MTNLRALKSGTDVRGKALGEQATLTGDIAARIGGAVVEWLKERGIDNPRIALGRDSRLTGEMLLEACANGCRLAGAQVECYGMCTTPAMYMSLITEGFACDGAIMLTASHHPFDRNGLKFFTKEGGIDSAELDEILTIAESESLWMIAPYGVLLLYLKDKALLAQAARLKQQGRCAHQLFCKEDFSMKRWLWYLRSQLNYYRKTARYYGNKGLKD